MLVVSSMGNREMANRTRRFCRRVIVGSTIVLAIVAVVGTVASGMSAQIMHLTGQNIVPVYEGWEKNPDGSFNLLFGYFNRNHLEEFDIPIGPDNNFVPGEPDQGQPTHFFPQRSRFLFRVHVPSDFGDKELVWTLTGNGKTEKTYATLNPSYFVDDIVIMNNNGAGGSGGGANDLEGNIAPMLTVEGDTVRHVRVGQPVSLIAVASDDGVPRPNPVYVYGRRNSLGVRCCPDAARGLRVSWFVYRGTNTVSFEPQQFDAWENYRDGADSPFSAGWKIPPVPEDGRWMSRATFSEPGTYVLRCLAHDGGLMTSADLTVVVGG